MKFSLQRAFLLPSIFCLLIALVGIAAVEGDETYGAYPGAPQSVTQPTPATVVTTTTPGPTTTTVVENTVTNSVQTGKTGMPVAQLGSVGRTSNTVSSSTITATYTTQAPPVTQQKVLLNYDVKATPPTAVYYSGTFMPWPSFSQVFPANSPALWVASSAGWSWAATCPTGGWIQNLMYVPYTGTMKLYEFYPDGSIKLYSYGFATPGYKYIWFYADTPGRHITLFTIYDKPSNYITIDVY
ncbi:MAG: hypothetical protein ACP5PV_03255 [Methanothrix sp.]